MAKQNYLKLAVVIVLTMAATSSAYADASSVGTSIGGSSFNPSSKVTCYYDSNGSDPTVFDGTVYAIACGHSQGDKVIAAQSGDARLYFKQTDSNAAAAGAANITAVTSGSAFDTSWSSM